MLYVCIVKYELKFNALTTSIPLKYLICEGKSELCESVELVGGQMVAQIGILVLSEEAYAFL